MLSAQSRTWSPPIGSWFLRFVLGMTGLTGIVLLGIAARLQPDPAGMGTHHQLGLPPCSLRVLAGIRCPSCGMTTSWALFTKGRWIAAARTNSGGTLLAFAAATVGPWLLASAIGNRWWGGEPNEWWFAFGGLAILVVTLIDWLVRLM